MKILKHKASALKSVLALSLFSLSFIPNTTHAMHGTIKDGVYTCSHGVYESVNERGMDFNGNRVPFSDGNGIVKAIQHEMEQGVTANISDASMGKIIEAMAANTRAIVDNINTTIMNHSNSNNNNTNIRASEINFTTNLARDNIIANVGAVGNGINVNTNSRAHDINVNTNAVGNNINAHTSSTSIIINNNINTKINSQTETLNNSISNISSNMISDTYNVRRGSVTPVTGTIISTNYNGDPNATLMRTSSSNLVIIKYYDAPTSVGDLVIN